eukprot:jgi/Botrbrau1/10196/Bobra.116_1s0012.1
MDDLDEWLELERTLIDDRDETDKKRHLQELNPNVTVLGRKRLKTTHAEFPDEDELLLYLHEQVVSEDVPSSTLGNRRDSREQRISENLDPFAGQTGKAGVKNPPSSTSGISGAFFPSPAKPGIHVSRAETPAEGQYRGLDDNSNTLEPDVVLPRRDPLEVDGDIVPVTSCSGERVYCGLRELGVETGLSSSNGGEIGRLLSQPWEQLKSEVEERVYQRAIQRAREEEGVNQKTTKIQDLESVHSKAGLWVERYAPKGFLDLLSDETINREVVRWLKSWDTCVFRAEASHDTSRAGKGRDCPAPSRHAGTFKGALRPEHKVLLLCGAPGLGKTTLAHVVARHCGYRPLELNASDSRTAEGLHNWLTDAAQTHSVTGDRRPNCIILDEVDGATGGPEGRGTIGTLLKLINVGSAKSAKGKGGAGNSGAKQKPEDHVGTMDKDRDTDEEDAEGPRTSGKGRSEAPAGRRKGVVRPLCRPVIAICNDLYAPALRPLRSVAHIVQFKTPTVDRISNRLRSICAAEGLHVDRQALNELLEVTRSDIRACLNALQFLSRRTSRVTVSGIKALGLASKDVTESAFTAWNQLFTSRKQSGAGNRAGEDGRRLLTMLEDMGDAELIFGGIHENVLQLRYMDTHMTRTALATSHLAHADILLRQCGRRGDFSLLRYMPPVALSVRSCVAGPSRPNLKWPRQHAEAQRRRFANQEMLRAWHLNIHPSLQSSLTISAAVQEVLPSIMSVVCRPLRPVAVRLLNVDEREALSALVATLADFSLNFDLGQAHMPDATALALLPPVHTVCIFPGLPSVLKPPAHPVRQMISHELQLESIRRREQSQAHANPTASGNCTQELQCDVEPDPLPPKDMPQALPLTIAQRAKAGPVKSVKVERKRNWLEELKGRTDAAKKPQVAKQGLNNPEGPRHWPVLYKFSQGYTNAVRRNVRMKDLL